MNVATQAMNEATQSMNRAAWISTGLVGLGTVLLIATLLLTLQANRAAIKSIDVTKTIGEAQTRAYLGVVDASIKAKNSMYSVISVRVKNTGLTPARDVVASFQVNPFAILGQEPITETAKKTYDLGAQVDHVISQGIRTPGGVFEWQEWKKSGDSMSVFVTISYTDVFRRRWVSEHNFSCSAADFSDGKPLTVGENQERREK